MLGDLRLQIDIDLNRATLTARCSEFYGQVGVDRIRSVVPSLDVPRLSTRNVHKQFRSWTTRQLARSAPDSGGYLVNEPWSTTPIELGLG